MLLQHLPLRLHLAATASWEKEKDKSFLEKYSLHQQLDGERKGVHTHTHTHTHKHTYVNTHTKPRRNIENTRQNTNVYKHSPLQWAISSRELLESLALFLSFSLSLLPTNPHLVRRLIIGRLMH